MTNSIEGFTIAQDSAGNTTLPREVLERAALYESIGNARDLGLMITAAERHERQHYMEGGGNR